jgi:hypothetical protein
MEQILMEDKRIIVITTNEVNARTGKMQLIASHGIDERTGRAVILPWEPPDSLGAVYNQEIGEYVIKEKQSH